MCEPDCDSAANPTCVRVHSDAMLVQVDAIFNPRLRSFARWGRRLPSQIRVLICQLLFTQPPIDLFQKIVDLEIKNATGLFSEAGSALRIRPRLCIVAHV